MESGSGVMVGRERRQGFRASSKTEVRFVRWRIGDLVCWIGVRRFLRRVQPFVLMALVSSSISARIGGTSKGKWVSRLVWLVGLYCWIIQERTAVA